MPHPDFSQFERRVGIQFADTSLLKTAFTHRSYINENRSWNLPHNERLEFLGDAVLELAVTDFLYHHYPDTPEGQLTSYRSALVNATMLAEVAEELGMNEFLLMSRGESKDTGRARQVLMANTMEAVIGAIYLDQGYTAAERFISGQLFHRIDEVVAKRLWQDAKSHFQEKAQEVHSTTPVYKTIDEQGPDHDKVFRIGVYLGDTQAAEGTGPSKQDAEQDAALNALKKNGWR